MAHTGDSYIASLSKSHLKWGVHRYTYTREPIIGEGYIPIPKKYAREFNILNSNGTPSGDTYGLNLFRFSTEDGLFSGTLKAQGCSNAGDIYAKQFAGNGDLKMLGKWYDAINASVGTRIKVTWISATDIILSKESS